jgi:outer membrane protein assembly factor BamB
MARHPRFPRRALWLAALCLSVGAGAPVGALSLYAVVPDNGTLPGQLWRVDPVNGNQLVGRPVTTGLSGLAADSSGTLWASTFGPSALLRVDSSDGSLLGSTAILDSLGNPLWVTDLAMQPGTDVLYATTLISDPGIETQKLYTIDVTSGLATLVGSTGIQSEGGGPIGFAPDGTLYYADWTYLTGELLLYRLDPTTGLKIGSPVASAPGNGSLAVGPDGLVYGTPALCCGGTIWQSDPNVAGSFVAYANLAVGTVGDLAFVPESSLVLLLSTGLAAARYGRRASRGRWGCTSRS